MKPCRSCGERGPCSDDCGCAKCIDPEGYAEWIENDPEAYAAWVESQQEGDE